MDKSVDDVDNFALRHFVERVAMGADGRESLPLV